MPIMWVCGSSQEAVGSTSSTLLKHSSAPVNCRGAGHPKRGQRQEAHLTGSANSEALLRRAPARLSSAIARCHQPVATNQRFAELPSWLSRTAWIAAAAPARPRCPTITCPASARADCVAIALVRRGGDRAHKTASEGMPRSFSNVEFTVGPYRPRNGKIQSRNQLPTATGDFFS